MTEPIKPKRRVTGQISLASPQTPSFSTPSASSSRTSTPIIRARIDPSASTTPVSRPSLRPTHSASSTPTTIRASASLPSVPTRPRSPVRVKSPLLPESSDAPGRARVRASSPVSGLSSPLSNSFDAGGKAGTPLGRIRARVGGNIGVKGFPTIETSSSPSTPNISRPPSRSENRPKIVKAQTTPVSHPTRTRALSNVFTTARYRPSASPLPSPIPAVPPISPVYLQTPGAGPSSIPARRSPSPQSTRSTSPHLPPARLPIQLSTPTLMPKPLLAHIPLDPMASCPPSPHHSALPHPAKPTFQGRRGSPEHPTSLRPTRPPLPESPEVRTVDLPELTPVTSAQDHFGDDGGVRNSEERVMGLGIEPMADIDTSPAGEGGNQDQAALRKSAEYEPIRSGSGAFQDEPEEMQGEDEEDMVEEARINRKVADLEISNASLLAINRTLEITKSKQRAEILRLRRALRESLAHPQSYAFPQPPISPFMETTDDPDETSSSLSTGEVDLNLNARWTKLEEMVLNMQKRAVGAVQAVREEPAKSGRAVLSWQDEDEEGSVGIGTPDRKRDGEG